ncbi:MAG: Stk1 family PASTA domain-containing Ser/Thr kinase [Actinobacteria bacterium]|nr:MAG: Stk1 family PASTA domain-containing Ser/Thr kinase [Actinomycetota bacterium]
MTLSDTLINTLFDGRYRIMRKLGSGGMADVYLAEDEELGRRVAIKILNDKYATDDQFIERFRREAKNAAGLSHPNIVSIYDRGEAEGTYYIAMEYLDGRSLKELVVARGPLPISDAISATRQVLAALRFAHRKGVVHRDIKPHNVMADADGRLKVTDFGIARAGVSQMTEAGSIIGTAQYLSPEQARGAPVDQRSDLYSIGIVLYEMLSGQVPFTGESPVEIAMKHLSDTPRPPSLLRPDIPPDLDMVVLRALAKSPEDRFQTAEEMDAELGRVASGVGVTAETADAATAVLSGTALASAPTAVVPPRRPPPEARRSYRYAEPPPRRRPVWPWLLALLLVVLAGVAGWYAFGKIQDSLGGSGTVSVPFVVQMREDLAVAKLNGKGLGAAVHRQPNENMKIGLVFQQGTVAGARVDKGTAVDIYVSTGPPKVQVPNVMGKSNNDAIAAITGAKLKFKVLQVFSKEDGGTVVAQDPRGGRIVNQGSIVHINVSKGLQPLQVPDVRGQLFDNAAGQLQGAGFAVARRDVDSSQPKDTVIDQDPRGGSSLSRGGTVTLFVSKGPKQATIPDVTSQDEASARQVLEQSGFSVDVQQQDVTDPNQDGIVLSQDPSGGTKAKPGTTVTIVVGHLVEVP